MSIVERENASFEQISLGSFCSRHFSDSSPTASRNRTAETDHGSTIHPGVFAWSYSAQWRGRHPTPLGVLTTSGV